MFCMTFDYCSKSYYSINIFFLQQGINHKRHIKYSWNFTCVFYINL